MYWRTGCDTFGYGFQCLAPRLEGHLVLLTRAGSASGAARSILD
jgi:hypothetical protein